MRFSPSYSGSTTRAIKCITLLSVLFPCLQINDWLLVFYISYIGRKPRESKSYVVFRDQLAALPKALCRRCPHDTPVHRMCTSDCPLFKPDLPHNTALRCWRSHLFYWQISKPSIWWQMSMSPYPMKHLLVTLFSCFLATQLWVVNG